MPFTLKDIGFGLLTPALVALLLTLGGARLAKGKLLPWVMPIAMVAGFLAGYWLLKLGPVVPKYDYMYLPYAMLLSLVPAMLPGRHWLAFVIKAFTAIAICCVAAWWLMPDWEAIKDLRTAHVVRWSIYSALVCVAIMAVARFDVQSAPSNDTAPAPDHESRWMISRQVLFVGLMIMSLASACVLLEEAGSLRFAQTAAAGMAALIGIAGGLWISKSQPSLDSLAVVYSVLVTNLLLTGWINSFNDDPIVSFLLVPSAPLAYLAIPFSRDAKPLNIRQTMISLGIGVVICCIALAMEVFRPR